MDAKNYISLLLNMHDELVELLCTVETLFTAEDEIYRSIEYLKNFEDKQKQYIPVQRQYEICCYLPLNQPLYSFVLNVLTAAFVCKKVYYRPPQKLWGLHKKMNDLLVPNSSIIEMETISRSDFLRAYVKKANVVVYTGKYKNVLELSAQLSVKTLLIYNGSAFNPIVVTKSADLDSCCTDIVNARLYNTGQDCMAPAAIFIHDDISDEFMRRLTTSLNKFRYGEKSWNPLVIGTILSEDSFAENITYISSNSNAIVYGGTWDSNAQFVSPTVFKWNRYSGEKPNIFFAPFFCIYQYAQTDDLLGFFHTKEAECYKGYISVYGSNKDIDLLEFSKEKLIVLRNETLFEFEEGNKEFGGYGEGCSFVMANGEKNIHPILLLREISEWRTYL